MRLRLVWRWRRAPISNAPAVFENVETAVRAFVGAGPTMLAISNSVDQQVADAVRDGIGLYTDPQGQVTLPGWYRAVFTDGLTSASPWSVHVG